MGVMPEAGGGTAPLVAAAIGVVAVGALATATAPAATVAPAVAPAFAAAAALVTLAAAIATTAPAFWFLLDSLPPQEQCMAFNLGGLVAFLSLSGGVGSA